MDKIRFITSPDYPETQAHDLWKNRVMNTREFKLKPGPGLLTLRKAIPVFPGAETARITVTALGIADIFVNDSRISKDELLPLWSDYSQRVMAWTYDVKLRQDPAFLHVLARVSPGWWSGMISFGQYGYRPAAFGCKVEIAGKGKSEVFRTDESWETAIMGPVMYADIWNGEYDDYNVVTDPDYGMNWKNAVILENTPPIVERMGPPVRVVDEVRPASAFSWSRAVEDGTDFGHIEREKTYLGPKLKRISVGKGTHLTYDFGQNVVGRPYFQVKGAPGTAVECLFAEMLNDSGEKSRGNDGPKGSAYILNYRSAMARYTCVIGPDREAVCCPRHTFYGFRYMEISAGGNVSVSLVKALVLSSDMKPHYSFNCSDTAVNKLMKNVFWGMRGNYLSVPTDCPQRDERLGWTGDTQIFCTAAAYLADTDGFLKKWLLYDAQDSQKGYGGAYSDVIPRLDIVGDGNAAWGDAGIIVAYKHYLMYGDKTLLERHYASMEAYMDYLSQFGLDGPKTAYGDWLCYEQTDKRYVSVCYYAYDALLMRKISEILGYADKAESYEDLRKRIVSKFRRDYMPDGELTETSQTACLLPVAFEILSGEDKERMIRKLADKIRDNGYTLSTGFLGSGILNQTLAMAGLDGHAYSLLLQTRDPSWLYPVYQGATTVWERWNSYTVAKGFGDPGMNSFNHYAYGAVAEWIFAYMLGIRPDPDRPGLQNHAILGIRPDFRKPEEIPEGQSRIRFAGGSSRGYTSQWEFRCGRLYWTVGIPARISATVVYPIYKHIDYLDINGVRMTASQLGARVSSDSWTFELKGGCKYEIGGEECEF